MAHFYGSVEGNGSAESRLGSTKSGMRTTAAGWRGAVTVQLRHNKETGEDEFSVYLTPWEGSEGSSRLLAEGTLDSKDPVWRTP